MGIGRGRRVLYTVTSIPAIVINICVALSPGPGLSTIEEDMHQVSLLNAGEKGLPAQEAAVQDSPNSSQSTCFTFGVTRPLQEGSRNAPRKVTCISGHTWSLSETSLHLDFATTVGEA
ncbi:unnamed protein product [Lepidochelys kempii]